VKPLVTGLHTIPNPERVEYFMLQVTELPVKIPERDSTLNQRLSKKSINFYFSQISADSCLPQAGICGHLREAFKDFLDSL